ncbi:response regulator [Candidatus Poribacteria bacterium]|nr:response regulator [Candidatus Poribacteria bacterium]
MQNRNSTVLIIDDIEDYLRSLATALKRDFTILTARSLEDAKATMAENSVNVVLSDIRLDESDPTNRDGLVFLEWSRGTYPRVPVVMMSAYREFDLAVDALNLGAAKFLKKPINLRELKALLKTLAGESS